MQDIKVGSATVCGTETAWILPGGRIIRSERLARMYAIRINELMKRGES